MFLSNKGILSGPVELNYNYTNQWIYKEIGFAFILTEKVYLGPSFHFHFQQRNNGGSSGLQVRLLVHFSFPDKGPEGLIWMTRLLKEESLSSTLLLYTGRKVGLRHLFEDSVREKHPSHFLGRRARR